MALARGYAPLTGEMEWLSDRLTVNSIGGTKLKISGPRYSPPRGRSLPAYRGDSAQTAHRQPVNAGGVGRGYGHPVSLRSQLFALANSRGASAEDVRRASTHTKRRQSALANEPLRHRGYRGGGHRPDSSALQIGGQHRPGLSRLSRHTLR